MEKGGEKMKLDELILKLQEIRKTLGEDCHVFVTGWNDTGIVEPDYPRLTRFCRDRT